MAYREANMSDISDLVSLCGEMFNESNVSDKIIYNPDVVAERFIKAIIADRGVVYVAEKDGGVIGFIGGYLLEYLFSQQHIAVEEIWYVRKSERKGMAGARLLKMFSRWGQENGAIEVQCGVGTGINTERTSRLIEALGFAPAGGIFKRTVEKEG